MTFLWFHFCFHDTAPICISAVALRTSPLTRVFPCHWSMSQVHVSAGPSLASLLEKPMHLWPSCGNGHELFRTQSQCVYKVSIQRNRLVPFVVWSDPWVWKQLWNLTAPFPGGFLCLGLTWPFWPAPPASSKTKWEGKKYSTEYLLGARLKWICKFGAINLIEGGSFRRIKQIDQGRTDNKW